jgi:phage terminase large subunit-like protein
MARKQGKTALVAALSLYSLLADDEEAAEILLAANSKDQAKIAFNMVRAYAKGLDPEEKKIKRFRSDIIFRDSPAFIKSLAADSSKMMLNCSLVL